MKYTSAEAAKLLRKLNEEVENLEAQEAKRREFNAAIGEDIETVRPAYDYADTQRKLKDLEKKIRMVKHTLNCFNSVSYTHLRRLLKFTIYLKKGFRKPRK